MHIEIPDFLAIKDNLQFVEARQMLLNGFKESTPTFDPEKHSRQERRMLYEVLERVGPKDVFCLLDEELRTTKRSRVHPVIIAKALGYEGPNVLTDVSIAIPRQHARNLPPMQRGLLLAEAYSLAVSRETALLDKATQENNGGEKFEAKKNLALLELHFSRIAARLKGLGLPL